MNKRQKVTRIETPSPFLFATSTRKNQNRSVDISNIKPPLKSSKPKQTQIFPLLMSIESDFYQKHFMHSLKESLTVKRIEFSPPKPFVGIHISTIPIHSKVPKTLAVHRVSSFKSMTKYKPKKKSREEIPTKKVVKKTYSPQITPKTSSISKKESIPQRIPISTPQPIKSVRPLPKILYREASRINSWCSKAKPELLKVWRKIITRSNGVEAIIPQSSQYKYYVGKGNNSRLINKCFSTRPWWVETDNCKEANYTWTQWKDKELLTTFDSGKSLSIEKADTISMVLVSPISVKVDKNQYRAVDIEELGFQYIRNSSSYTFLNTCQLDPNILKMHNKIEFNQHLSNKKGLFRNMKNYYTAIGKNVFDYVPLTFHIIKGASDPEYLKFEEEFLALEQERIKNKIQNIWIVKPGENTNRGQGISLGSSLEQIKSMISVTQDPKTFEPRTYIIQKYIEKPFLIHKRKFDIRCYSLITSINGIIQGYNYSDGYLRTTSSEYTTKDIANCLIHLTNDAIQKYSEEYGKYEDANKLSYKDFQRYLDYHCCEKKINFIADVVPEIKNIIKDTISAVYLKIDPNKRLHCMEIFGYDFMLDSNLKPWLIEVNTNPCLELASCYLASIIPAMVENSFRIAVDPLFPQPNKWVSEQNLENKYELIFHQEIDGKILREQTGDNFDLIQRCEELSDTEEIFSDVE